MFKKTLQVKLKNTLQDAPLVLNPVSSVLNREETLSVQDKVLACNSPEVDLLQHTGDQNLRVSDTVYVLNIKGFPLMPTFCRKARLLLKTGKAVVVSRFPFTIQLTYQTGENKQEITLGVDPGYKNVGFSCITETKELICGTVELDNNTSGRLTERSSYRRNRRNKLRYREPRFNNRIRKLGWLPPSVERRYQTHLSIVNKLRKILPIHKIIVESCNFDIQKLNNPEIKGKEYQEGNLLGYFNSKSYILSRENHCCQLCGKSDSKTDSWRLHHIIERSKGGTDKPDNLALLHKSCHKRLHKQGLKLKKNKQYKDSTFMNIIKNRLQKELNCDTTFGYITHFKRNELELEKTHFNDAFIIAGGICQKRISDCFVVQKRKNNRSIQLNRKGFKPSIRKQRYKLQPKDLVKVLDRIFEVVGTHCRGKNVVLKNNGKNVSISIKKISWYFNVKTLIWNMGGSVNSSPC